MAGRRHRSADSIKRAEEAHLKKLRYLSKRGEAPDPFNPRSVSRRYNVIKNKERIPRELERKADKATRSDARKHGFRVTTRGVVVDGPRDRMRKPIKGSSVKVLRGGVVRMSTKTKKGKRDDYVVGFTKKEKEQFARDPKAFQAAKLAELRKRFPKMKGAKIQTRLQWGAYQGTKEFSPTHFMKLDSGKYWNTQTPDERKRRAGKPPIKDRLTGFHFVIHVPVKRAKRAKKK